MIEKQNTIETRVDMIDGCYGIALWEGKTLVRHRPPAALHPAWMAASIRLAHLVRRCLCSLESRSQFDYTECWRASQLGVGCISLVDQQRQCSINKEF